MTAALPVARHALGCLLLAASLAGCALRVPPPRAVALDDPALRGYVQGLVCRLAAACTQFDVLLVDSRSVQAELLDDGQLAVRLGLLLAVEDEAELLFVLAHEMAHRQLGHAPPARFDERLPLELAADAAAVTRLSELGYPQGAGHRLIKRLVERGLTEAPAAAREQIAQRLQALPDGEAVTAAPLPARLQRLLLPYRSTR